MVNELSTRPGRPDRAAGWRENWKTTATPTSTATAPARAAPQGGPRKRQGGESCAATPRAPVESATPKKKIGGGKRGIGRKGRGRGSPKRTPTAGGNSWQVGTRVTASQKAKDERSARPEQLSRGMQRALTRGAERAKGGEGDGARRQRQGPRATASGGGGGGRHQHGGPDRRLAARARPSVCAVGAAPPPRRHSRGREPLATQPGGVGAPATAHPSRVAKSSAVGGACADSATWLLP